MFILIINIVLYYIYTIKVCRPCKQVLLFYKKRPINLKYSSILDLFNATN